jgi:hypothetical protein
VWRRVCALGVVVASAILAVPGCSNSSGGVQYIYEAGIECSPVETLCGLPAVGGDASPEGAAPVEAGIVDGATGEGGAAGLPYCANLSQDPTNCGACGNTCAQLTVCVSGKCVSGCGSDTLCSSDAGAYCADTLSDSANCGACGRTCATGQTCTGGACVAGCTSAQTLCGADGGASYCANIQTDNANCGGCGHVCGAGQLCTAGACTSARSGS